LIGVPLFFLLQSVSVGTASTLLPDNLAPPAARLVAFGLFAAIQATAGLPLDQWALRPSATKADWSFLDSPLAAVAVFASFALLAFSPVAVAALSGQTEFLQAMLPAAGALPPPARLFDVLLAAPLTEELFFRAWLLSAAQRAGATPAAAVACSALTFALWHSGGGSSGGGLLTFGLLGAWLAIAYTKGGQRLSTTVGAHALYNAAIVALRVARGG
jgi:membrane protease YdiL (CAAX protease family)